MDYRYKVAAIDTIVASMNEKIPTTNSHAQGFIAIAGQLRASVEAFGKLQATPNPTITQAAHDKAVATAGQKLKAQAKAATDKLNQTMRNGLLDIDARIAAKVNLKPDSEYGKEIREVFRRMPYTEQLEMLKQLSADGKGKELASIIEVPALLTGIKPELQEVYRNDIIYKHARAEYDERNVLLNSILPAMSVAQVASETATELSVNSRRLGEINAAENAANSAQAAFDSAATQL